MMKNQLKKKTKRNDEEPIKKKLKEMMKSQLKKPKEMMKSQLKK